MCLFKSKLLEACSWCFLIERHGVLNNAKTCIQITSRRWLSSGFLRHVVWYKSTEVSEVLAASIISALMMEAANTSETTVYFYQTTRHNSPEDSHFYTRRRENSNLTKIESRRP
jgi:hypothetical protein